MPEDFAYGGEDSYLDASYEDRFAEPFLGYDYDDYGYDHDEDEEE